MHEIESFEHAGRTVRIYVDPDPESPREWDNLATLACWHRRMNLGDEQIDACTEEELRERLADQGEEVLAVLPIYCYQHSGVTVSTRPFSCPWDSGQVGWAYVTRRGAERMGCVGMYQDRETGETKAYDQAFFEDAIRQEIATYAEYLEGRVYGYEIEELDGETIDSLWGIFGLEYTRAEARGAAEHTEDPAVQAEADELAARATFAGGEEA